MNLKAILTRARTDAATGFQLFSIGRQSTTFLIGIMLAKSLFSLEQIGMYEVWLILGMIITFFGLSGGYQTFLSLLADEDPKKRTKKMFSVFVTLWILTTGIALFFLLSSRKIVPLIFSVESIDFLPWVILYLLLHLNAALTPYLFLVKGMPVKLLNYSIYYFLGSLISVILPLYLSPHLFHLLIGLLVWAVIEQGYLIFLLYKNSVLKLDFKFINKFIWLTIPLTIYAGSGFMAQIFDAWLVNFQYRDLAVFAIFKYGAREIPGAIALASAFSAAMILYYSKYQIDGLYRIKKSSARFMHFFFPLTIVLLFVSRYLFEIVYNASFVESAIIFNTYLLIMITRWIFPQAILISMKKNNELIWISLGELAVNIFFSLFFIRYFGLVGIALGTVVACLFEKMAMVLVLQKKYKIKARDYIPVRELALYSTLLLVIYVILF